MNPDGEAEGARKARAGSRGFSLYDGGVAQVVCPACGEGIATADVNVAEGVALCRGCGELSRLSDMVEGVAPKAALDAEPPAGCRVEDDGVMWHAVVSARSLPGAFGAIFVAAFWNSIVSVFVGVAVGGLWVRLIGPLPSWVPMKSAGPPMPLGMLLFLCVFLTPFVAIGAIMIGAVCMCIAGHVSVRVRGGSGVVFSGVGPIGWRRRFDALAVTSVRLRESRDSEGGTRAVIEMCMGDETGKKLRFGSMLRENRRAWLAGVCRAVLEPGPSLRGIREHSMHGR